MRIISLLFSLLLVGCNLRTLPLSDPLSIPETIEPTQMITAEANIWKMLLPGLERRQIRSGNTLFESVRIDPNYFSFRVHYQPGDPLALDRWQATLPTAEVIINANFFHPDHTILGLLVSDGIAYGQALNNRGGTFFVQNGLVGIRSNVYQPYNGDPFEQAIQAFPMLVYNGAAAYQNARDTRPSRRTIIGQDSAGRITLLVTPGFDPGLYELSQQLPQTDLELTHALNLDGGGSTMMYIAQDHYRLRSFDPVPAVLAIYPKER